MFVKLAYAHTELQANGVCIVSYFFGSDFTALCLSSFYCHK